MSEKKQFPRAHPIPQSVIEKWVRVPSNETVHVQITRQDIDNLFFAINNLVDAVYSTQQSLILLSNNENHSANEEMHRAQFKTIEATNSLNNFLTNIATQHFVNSEPSDGR